MNSSPCSKTFRLSPGQVLLRTLVAVAAIVLAQSARAQETQTRSPLQIWFIRHAESEVNVTTGPRPQTDPLVSYPLTKKGVDQAVALGEALAAAPITSIYTSTMLRAIQTADAVAFRHGKTLSLVPEAVEVDLDMNRGGGEDVRAVYGELARKWVLEKDLAFRHGEGESFLDVQRRFLPFVRELMNRHANDTGVIVVVAHSVTLGFMVPVLATNAPPELALRRPLPNTGIIKTELRDDRLYCLEWAGEPCSLTAP